MDFLTGKLDLGLEINMKLNQFFEEPDSEKKSVVRLIFFLWGIGTLATWIYVSFAQNKIATIDNSVVTTFLGLAAGKTAQRYLESGNKE